MNIIIFGTSYDWLVSEDSKSLHSKGGQTHERSLYTARQSRSGYRGI
jgi:hypothetical protein